ncbi:MAG TPA: hypothetical protein PK082_01685 [Phycisphaerae bacterium]|nr:hypothetical protein [Phycisphaerae bacterium]
MTISTGKQVCDSAIRYGGIAWPVQQPKGSCKVCGCGFPSAEGKTDSAAIRAWNRNVNEYLKSAVGRQNARRAKEA